MFEACPAREMPHEKHQRSQEFFYSPANRSSSTQNTKEKRYGRPT